MPHLPEPTDEQVGRWLIDDGYPWDPSEQAVITITTSRLKNVARQASEWGADEELKACKQWMRENKLAGTADVLHAARRPKPPTLKEQAFAILDLIQGNKKPWQLDELNVVRRALEQLPEQTSGTHFYV